MIQNKPPAGLQHEDKKEEKFDTRSVDEIAQGESHVILMEAQRQAGSARANGAIRSGSH